MMEKKFCSIVLDEARGGGGGAGLLRHTYVRLLLIHRLI